MGLSGRKEKQRIPNDPRNLSWADNATKFGQAYLSKLGWDPSKGLGANGDGCKTHIKVSQKLDMLGIGAGQSKDPNGIAWKQNKEFEALLKRLNESVETESGADEVRGEVTETVEGGACGQDETKKRKRKKADNGVDGTEKKTKKRKKDKGFDQSSSKATHAGASLDIVEETVSTTAIAVKVAAPRHMAHRARYIASKRLASKSTSAISEILGIAPSASPLPSAPTTPMIHGTLTQLDETYTLEKLTTSTKSVADYFKERLSTTTSTSSLPPEEDTPRMGLGMPSSKFASLTSGTFLASLPAVAGATEDAIIANVTDAHLPGDEPAERNRNKQEKTKKKRKEKEKRKLMDNAAAESNAPSNKYNKDEKAQRREKKAKEKRRQTD